MRAPDAVVIDSTDLDLDAVVARIVELARRARAMSDVPADDYRFVTPDRFWGFWRLLLQRAVHVVLPHARVRRRARAAHAARP